ncbi:MAG: putative glycosyltransferase [Planctomycetota bacterium]|nr:putative glycosyltransferase [Planctomycetota bacterium]
MTLSVCLLTRNEEGHLERALRSVAAVADQLLVVDTGSTDQTVEIARSCDAQVHSIAWDDDFGAGRNATIALANGDWIFWLHPDEVWLGPGREDLAGLMADDGVFGYLVKIRNLIQADRSDRFSETLDIRLFRKVPAMQFVGRLHPRFTAGFAENVRTWGRPILPSSITLESSANLSPKTEAKARWTLQLLERELADRPGQLDYMIEHARTLGFLGDPRTEDALTRAAECVVAQRDAPDAPTVKTQHLLEQVIGGAPPRSFGALNRQEAIRLTLRWFRNSPPLLWTLASSHYDRSEFFEAAAVLEHLVSLGQTGHYDRSRPFDPSIITDHAVLNLGVCYAKIGRTVQAISCFETLASHPRYGTEAVSYLEQLRGA